MVYVDYEYYKTKYIGTVPEDFFDLLVIKASKEIDKNVNTRLNEDKINNLPEEAQEQLKYTACALIDLIYEKQESDNRKISSISIDGVNKTFKAISSEEYKRNKKDALDNLPIELTRYL